MIKGISFHLRVFTIDTRRVGMPPRGSSPEAILAVAADRTERNSQEGAPSV